MKIAVLDDSRVFLSYIKKQFSKLGYENVYIFHEPFSFYEFFKNDMETDVVFIDYHLKETDGLTVLKQIKNKMHNTYKIMITGDSDPKLKEKALEIGFDNFLKKDISLIDLKALLNTVSIIRKYIKKEQQKKEELKKLLLYKEKQEKIIHRKQNKIMKNELEMFFDDNYLFETYFSPKDMLTGDTIHTKKLSEKEYFIGVIDAMGKGLGASLTSFNALSFLKHSVKKAIEYRDFNFEKLVEDFINYIRTILLDNEILTTTLVYIRDNDVYYANFGNPPVLTSQKTVASNNFPITYNGREKIQIDSFKMENKLLISSDGIFESPYEDTIYYKRLKKLFPEITFLKELIEDFNSFSHQTDDMSMVYITKETLNYDLMFEDTVSLNKNSIDVFLEKLINTGIESAAHIHFILHEILTNTYEYGVLNIKNRDKTYKEKRNYDNQNKKFFAKIKLYKNKKWIKIEYEDNTKGFDVQTIKDAFYQKYHGRGIKIIKHLSHGLFFNKKGTKIKIFLKV